MIKSTKAELKYTINYINNEELSFSADTRSGGNPEFITKEDFLKVMASLKKLKEFNTSSAKEVFLGSKIYQKRSPMFALLHSSEIIEKISD